MSFEGDGFVIQNMTYCWYSSDGVLSSPLGSRWVGFVSMGPDNFHSIFVFGRQGSQLCLLAETVFYDTTMFLFRRRWSFLHPSRDWVHVGVHVPSQTDGILPFPVVGILLTLEPKMYVFPDGFKVRLGLHL